jgi:exo-1,4-beta-D-glucosaminidase
LPLQGRLRLALILIFEVLMSKLLIAAGRCVSALALLSAVLSSAQTQIPLHQGWQLQSSQQAPDSGDVISKSSYVPKGWIATTVPSTVVAAQNAAGEFKRYGDIFVGMNLRKLPGMAYDIGQQFAHMPIPADSPYSVPWWYRTEFASPAPARHVALHFDGINNRANIWLNGKKIAGANDVAGAYRTYEFDITPDLVKTGKNVLAVQVFAQTQNDLGINWVDWNPTPPDKDMGLWEKVYLTTSGPVEVRYPAVTTHLPEEDKSPAELAILAQLKNVSEQSVSGTFSAHLKELGLEIEQPVTLAAGETRSITLGPRQFPQLTAKNPQLWWPAQMGKPYLYHLTTSFVIGNTISDSTSTRVGLREITSEMTGKGARLYRVNGKPILIRGGGWSPDMLLRHDSARLRNEFEYVRDMNLNTIRLEGKMEDDEFFRLADEKGILIMAGWCCCDLWEEWEKWQGDQLAVATDSVRSQGLRLRSHPSLLMWLNGSDNPPPAKVESAYLAVLQETQWPNPIESSATQSPAELSGPSGVKMTGPYDYVPPSYWLTDQHHGGAYGFNTETSPGPAIPLVSSLAKFIPADHLWPMDDLWNFHSGSGGFKDLKIFNTALNAMYGAPSGLDDYERKSQAMAYDGERAMFEAYSRNKYTSTGVIQWMLNNAWPSLIWHLYDYYLQPAGGYFGAKKANEPVHIQYSFDDRSVVAVNSTYQAVAGLTASVRLTDLHLTEEFAHSAPVEVGPDGVKTVLTVPEPPASSGNVHFLELTLKDAQGKLVSTNFYWLSLKRPELDWSKTTYISTPISTYEDFTALASLPQVRLKTSATMLPQTAGDSVRLSLTNPSKDLAFQIRLAVDSGSDNSEILPVLWEDNYVSLMPGEERTVEARFPDRHLAPGSRLLVTGWNIAQEYLPLGKPAAKKSGAKSK